MTFKVGDRVRVLRNGNYRGNPRNPASAYFVVGEVVYITLLGTDRTTKWDSPEEEANHVAINRTNDPAIGAWIDVESLELYDPQAEEEAIQAALDSISEAAKHQEHVVIFRSITIQDGDGKVLRVQVEGQKVQVLDEYEELMFAIDLDTWSNVQEVVDMAFRQIDPTHMGKEKK